MDQRNKCADICDVAQVTDICILPNYWQLISIRKSVYMSVTRRKLKLAVILPNLHE